MCRRNLIGAQRNLSGLSVTCIRNVQSTGQGGRFRTASLRMRGIRECVRACMQHTWLQQLESKYLTTVSRIL